MKPVPGNQELHNRGKKANNLSPLLVKCMGSASWASAEPTSSLDDCFLQSMKFELKKYNDWGLEGASLVSVCCESRRTRADALGTHAKAGPAFRVCRPSTGKWKQVDPRNSLASSAARMASSRFSDLKQMRRRALKGRSGCIPLASARALMGAHTHVYTHVYASTPFNVWYRAA